MTHLRADASIRFRAVDDTPAALATLRDLGLSHRANLDYTRDQRAIYPPEPPPLSINSEGADGLAGLLFGQGAQPGWGFAQLCGWHCVHARDSRGQEIEGLPDWICIRECVIYVELKRQRDELRPAQVDMAARLIAAGAHYYLVRPGDFTDFCTVLIHGPKER